MLLLWTMAALYVGLVVSGHGVLFWLTNTTLPPPLTPVENSPGVIGDSHGSLRMVRCHYFTGTGTFNLDTTMAFRAPTCGLLKRRSTAVL
jgi:hypothetical protein